jgi:hypothetical protein
MLKNARKRLDERIEQFRVRLKAHQDAVKGEIENNLKHSRDQVVEYYLPAARSNPPDELIGRSLRSNVSDETLQEWIAHKLAGVFPSAEEVVSDMKLEVSFKDVTFETLNDPDFFERLKKEYPEIDWTKPYEDFRAMGEDRST